MEAAHRQDDDRTVATTAAKPHEATVLRRGLIVGAVAATAAVIAGEGKAQAADGGSFILGNTNSASSTTVLTNGTTTSATGLQVNATAASYGIGVEGNGTGYGVFGNSDGYAGVFGRTNGSSTAGVSGYHANSSGSGVGVSASSGSPSGAGVHAVAAGIGVYAEGGGFGSIRPDGTYGLYARSTSVAGAFESAHAPLLLVRSPDVVGAPVVGDHVAGEFWVDSAGKLFYCTTDGAPGTWIELSAAITELPPPPPPPDPVVIPPTLRFLPTPERFVDTRKGSGGVTGPISTEQTRTFSLTSRVGEAGNPELSIPDEAIAIAGNVTVIGQPGTAGYLTLWPTGNRPTVSTVNWGPANPDNPVANSFQVGLAEVEDGHKGLRVFNKGACDYIVDITGYYM